METFVNGTTALLQTLQEELGSLQRNSFEENLVPIFLSASTSAIVLGESTVVSYLLGQNVKRETKCAGHTLSPIVFWKLADRDF